MVEEVAAAVIFHQLVNGRLLILAVTVEYLAEALNLPARFRPDLVAVQKYRLTSTISINEKSFFVVSRDLGIAKLFETSDVSHELIQLLREQIPRH